MNRAEDPTRRLEQAPPWKTVRLGRYKNAHQYFLAIESAKRNIGSWAKEVLNTPMFTCSTREMDIDLIAVSVAELGLSRGGRYDGICTRALDIGLALCPVEVAAALGIDYPDQPRNEMLIVGMVALAGSSGEPTLFVLENEGGVLWLRGFGGSPSRFWKPRYRFVFTRTT
jgi:hypothetical protein